MTGPDGKPLENVPILEKTFLAADIPPPCDCRQAHSFASARGSRFPAPSQARRTACSSMTMPAANRSASASHARPIPPRIASIPCSSGTIVATGSLIVTCRPRARSRSRSRAHGHRNRVRGRRSSRAAVEAAVLKRPYAVPTHYGMGKYGWVTLTFKSAKRSPSTRCARGSKRRSCRWRRRSCSRRATGPAKRAESEAEEDHGARAARVRRRAAIAARRRGIRAARRRARRGGNGGAAQARQGQSARHRHRAQSRRRHRACEKDRRGRTRRCTCSSPAYATPIKSASCATPAPRELFSAPAGDAKVADAVARALIK